MFAAWSPGLTLADRAGGVGGRHAHLEVVDAGRAIGAERKRVDVEGAAVARGDGLIVGEHDLAGAVRRYGGRP